MKLYAINNVSNWILYLVWVKVLRGIRHLKYKKQSRRVE